MVAVVALTAVTISAMAGFLMAGDGLTPKQVGDSLAVYFKIGNRPPVITNEEVEKRIANFPDFGDKTVAAMKAAAPIDSLTKLESLKNAGGKGLLNKKQIVLLLTFYNLKP
jgi:hypothetical protein